MLRAACLLTYSDSVAQRSVAIAILDVFCGLEASSVCGSCRRLRLVFHQDPPARQQRASVNPIINASIGIRIAATFSPLDIHAQWEEQVGDGVAAAVDAVADAADAESIVADVVVGAVVMVIEGVIVCAVLWSSVMADTSVDSAEDVLWSTSLTLALVVVSSDVRMTAVTVLVKRAVLLHCAWSLLSV